MNPKAVRAMKQLWCEVGDKKVNAFDRPGTCGMPACFSGWLPVIFRLG